MVKCWANSLGDCNSTQSKEHYVSKNLFDGDVAVSGFKWLKEETKVFKRSDIGSNILCSKHNSDLSVLDAEAGKTLRTLKELMRVQEVRKNFKKLNLSLLFQSKIKGDLLERWAAKVVIGLFCVVGKDKEYWHLNGKDKWNPPQEIVAPIYGKTHFKEPVGLYVAMKEGEDVDFPDGVSISPLFYENEGLVGAILYFKGIRFLVWLYSESPNSSFIEEKEILLIGEKDFMYNPKKFKFSIGGCLSQILEMSYDEKEGSSLKIPKRRSR